MDPPARVVDFVYRRLQVDAEWSTRTDSGFAWWAGELAQRVWTAPPRDAEGVAVTAVHIETDLLSRVQVAPDTLARLASINQLASLSAYMADPASLAVRLHASVSVTEDNWPLARALALHAAAIQVADAHAEAHALAEIFGATVDRTSPPNQALRTERDDMVAVVAIYQQHGEGPSPFSTDELASLVQVEPRPWTRASSSVDSLVAELPFYSDRAAHLELDRARRHPALGSGLHIRLVIPVEATPSMVHHLNESELAQPDAHQLGAWCLHEERGLAFVSFVPAAAYLPHLARALVYHMAARCLWARAILG